MKKVSKFWIFVIIYCAITVLLNILAIWHGFCDFYTDNLFWISSAVYSRITGIFAFSVGEILICLAAALIISAVILSVVLIFLKKKAGFVCFCKAYYKSFLVIAITVALIMTLNCSIPYNCSKLEFNGGYDKEYLADDLIALRNYIVKNCNELSQKVPRDEKGNVVCPDNLHDKIVEGLYNISDEFPRMKGYFPEAKAMFGSKFMYQAGMLGVYFPFTMEANYNKYVSASYTPSTIAHELSHLKGYMFENEANFISYLACISSKDVTVRYSGFLSVMWYVERDLMDIYLHSTLVDEVEYSQFCGGIMPSDLVYSDDKCYTEETVDELENSDFILDTDFVADVSDKFTDMYLDYYNAEANYAEVTALLLQYYDGKLN